MKLVYNIKDIPKKYRYIFTIGNFDGFHTGHQKILKALLKEKKIPNDKILLITFVVHTRDIDGSYDYLTSKKDTEKFFALYGVDFVLKLDFKKIKDVEYDEFLKWLNDNLDLKAMILTEKLRIGHNRKGTTKKIISTLQALKNDIAIKCIPLVVMDHKPVSTTAIKKLIQGGNFRQANKLLGYKYRASDRQAE
ncbi:MAG: hypothetical protein Q8P11_03395 [bacterium]|nr:hypothetical protein [bacterium]